MKTSRAIAYGLTLAVVSAVSLSTTPHGRASRLVAAELVVCYLVYVGFALWRRSGLLTESAFAALGVVLAVLALWRAEPAWVALGWALHGCWDLLHLHGHDHEHGRRQRRTVGVHGVPRWYIPLCAFYDFPVALTILAVFYT